MLFDIMILRVIKKTIKQYDLIVVGSGSGGLVAAEVASRLGAKVALIEKNSVLGGECLNNGCIPSKSLIHLARKYYQANQLSMQINQSPLAQIDISKVNSYINSKINFIEKDKDNVDYLQRLGVDVYLDEAEFLSPTSLKAGSLVLNFKRCILSLGSRPNLPKLDGQYHKEDVLTNENVFNLDKLPKKLAVLGGGPIGCEIGQALAMLKVEVMILQSASRLLPRDEPEASEILLNSFKEMGVKVYLNSKLKSINSKGPNNLYLTINNNEVINANKLLVAVGRQAPIIKGADLAKIKLRSDGFIAVDKHLLTTNKTIYAVGDCNGMIQFTHAAAQQAVIAVKNSLYNLRQRYDSSRTPWATFTQPEIAHFGPAKEKLVAEHAVIKVENLDIKTIDRAVTDNDSGYIQIIYDQRQRIIAATAVSNNAAEIINMLEVIAYKKSPKLPTQIYPTYSQGLEAIISEQQLKRIADKRLVKLAKIIFRN